MKNLILAGTESVPDINMDADTGIISIKGKSYPENTFKFYQPFMSWINNYFAGNAQEKTQINIEIIYFNSSSSKLLFAFFKILNQAKDNHKIEVNWLYDKDNESALEAGEDFIADFKELKINLLEKA
ncbi:MAG: DUF1987 domain-containing protein [gamma proteobacterium symbiont of Taylorina sp.]|nr:DUF1987 domain-containing protein [gamma proteobacterium symbiont of Taylorina sp.]